MTNIEIKKYLGLSLAAAELLTLTSCVSAAKEPSERNINTISTPPAGTTVLRGEGYEIRRFSPNVLLLSGPDQPRGIAYLQSRKNCGVRSVGIWEPSNASSAEPSQHTVVVEGWCMPELESPEHFQSQ